MADTLGIKPKWGPRTAHLFEIGTLGSFISETLCRPPEPETFAAAVNELCRRAEEKLSWLYEAKDASGRERRERNVNRNGLSSNRLRRRDLALTSTELVR